MSAALLRLEFFDVDLRWGVLAKDANGETANSWEYCRQWIERMEPFFVCILSSIRLGTRFSRRCERAFFAHLVEPVLHEELLLHRQQRVRSADDRAQRG